VCTPSRADSKHQMATNQQVTGKDSILVDASGSGGRAARDTEIDFCYRLNTKI